MTASDIPVLVAQDDRLIGVVEIDADITGAESAYVIYNIDGGDPDVKSEGVDITDYGENSGLAEVTVDWDQDDAPAAGLMLLDVIVVFPGDEEQTVAESVVFGVRDRIGS